MTQPSDILSDILNNFTRLFAPAPPATVAPAHGADEWQPLIEETKHLEAALEQLRQRTATLRAATSPAQRSTQRSPAEEPQALEAVHNQAAAEILALHAHLQTHLTLEELQHGQALMRELDAVVLGASGGDLEQRIRAAVINRLVQECAPLAWQTLLTLMARAQVSWPDPMGLSPHAEAQDVQAARQRELTELEETFLRMVLQAVGSGILGYLLNVAVTKLREDAPDFTARVEHVLHEELATMQQAMQAGVHSVTDADALMASVNQLGEEVVPTMAWEAVAPEVHKALQRFKV